MAQRGEPAGSAPPLPPPHLQLGEADELATELNMLLADSFALHLKTKSFEWRMRSAKDGVIQPLLEAAAAEIIATVDPIAERVSALGAVALRSIAEVQGWRRVTDARGAGATPAALLRTLADDNARLLEGAHAALEVADRLGDCGTAALLEALIDAGDQRVWRLRQAAAGLEPRAETPARPAPSADAPATAEAAAEAPADFLHERAMENDIGGSGVHPDAVLSVAVGFGVMLAAAWVFFSGGGGLTLGVASLLFLMFFAIFVGGALTADRPPTGTLRGFSVFLRGRVQVWTGGLSGREAYLQIALLPAALAVAMICLGVIWQLWGLAFSP
jgi:starvation-inducible DNA-binding protein